MFNEYSLKFGAANIVFIPEFQYIVFPSVSIFFKTPMNFSNSIIQWYLKHKRDLPWRDTLDPYKIWLSEIILQQTRVEQGLPYYLKFTDAFPTITDLANASEDIVLKHWQGLGYYSRARNLHHSAQTVRDRFQGRFPSSYSEIISLKGVGEYTAAAIASFSYNLPHAVVDGNVIRVISRVFGVLDPVDSMFGLGEVKSIAARELDLERPALHNQAIMEFGALQCVPVNPNCGDCPLSGVCYAKKMEVVKEIPLKSKKTAVKNLFLYYAVVKYKNGLFVKRRDSEGIWKGLYDFPVLESETPILEEQVLSFFNKEYALSNQAVLTDISPAYRHLLSHRKIEARFFRFEVNNIPSFSLDKANWFSVDKILEKGVPRLIERYFEAINLYK